MLFLSLHKEMHIVLALLSLTAASASVAIADVTVDACVAQKSGIHPSLAADMQSLCALSASIGSLVGFSFSGVFVHLIGPQVSSSRCFGEIPLISFKRLQDIENVIVLIFFYTYL